MTDSNCLFCRIIAGELSCRLAYQDEQVIAFHDISPQAPHHLLIVPRKHIATTLDLSAADDQLIGHVYRVAGELARELGFAADGFRVVNNCNAAGGQTVWHLHFHLLGGRNLTWPPG